MKDPSVNFPSSGNIHDNTYDTIGISIGNNLVGGVGFGTKGELPHGAGTSPA